jgi:hypothetical protein
MSAIVGSTLNNATSSASASKPSVSINNKSSSMSSSSVLMETARFNGNQVPPSETVESNATTAVITEPLPAVSSSEVKEDQSRGASDNPLPTEIQRILGEVARTGSCSWLPWTRPDAKDKEGRSSLVSTAPVASATYFGSTSGKSTPPAVSNNSTLKYALGSRRPYMHRLGTSSGITGSGAAKAPRARPKNGLKRSRMRQDGGSKTQTGTSSGGTKKRPFLLLRTSPAGTSTAGGVFSPGSVGSGRTSGSEPDDSTQYECDSEGTSATSCSELSTERRDRRLRNMQLVALQASKKPPPPTLDEVTVSQGEYKCLKDVFRTALGLVLDHWYHHQGGYKLSPAEKRRSETATVSAGKAKSASSAVSHTLVNGTSNGSHNGVKPERQTIGAPAAPPGHEVNNMSSPAKLPTKDVGLPSVAAEEIFQQRRHRLLIMLGQQVDDIRDNSSSARRYHGEDDCPPFTIQRIAEVLIAPERVSMTKNHLACTVKPVTNS